MKSQAIQTFCFIILAASNRVGQSLAAEVPDLEAKDCSSALLDRCMAKLPVASQVGLPRTQEELDAHCTTYQNVMDCMDAWMYRCLPTDGQRLIQKQTGGARALMKYLCNNTTLRTEFLKEKACWPAVSGDMSWCVSQLQLTANDIAERSQLIAYIDRKAELCCARDEFDRCVSKAGRTRCVSSAASLLRRISRLLATDVASCSSSTSRTTCASNPPTRPFTPFAFIPPLLAIIILY